MKVLFSPASALCFVLICFFDVVFFGRLVEDDSCFVRGVGGDYVMDEFPKSATDFVFSCVI